MAALGWIDRWSQARVLVLTAALLALLGVVDYWSGPQISFGLFYLMPVWLAAWCVGRRAGVLASVASGWLWHLANQHGMTDIPPFVALWNGVIRMGFFLAVALLTAKVRELLDRERQLARTDYLTGTTNIRGFYEESDRLLTRAEQARVPFSFAYIDINHFKQINDRLGHTVGSQLLVRVSQVMREQIGERGTVARLGGDEFAILLPERGEADALQTMRELIAAVNAAMAAEAWGVSLSIGLVVCDQSVCDVDCLIQIGDELMYAAKRGRNGLAHRVLGRCSGGVDRSSGVVVRCPTAALDERVSAVLETV